MYLSTKGALNMAYGKKMGKSMTGKKSGMYKKKKGMMKKGMRKSKM